MTTLKEFAAKLFEEEKSTGVAVADKAAKHAAGVSGIDPKLGSKKDLGVASKKEGESESWDNEKPVKDVDEDKCPSKIDVKSSAGFGDTNEKPEVEFEVDDAELAEAVRSIRKENIKNKIAELKEADKKRKDEKSWEDGEPEGGDDPSHENLKEVLDEMLSDEVEEEGMNEEDENMNEEMGLEEDEEISGEEDDYEGDEDLEKILADLVVNIDLPDELGDALRDVNPDDLHVDLELVSNEDAEPVEDEESTEEETGEDELPSSEEEDVLLQDDDEEEVMETMHDELAEAKKMNKVLEAKLGRFVKLAGARKNEASELKKQLVETNLFTARLVYLNKFAFEALNEDSVISKKTLQRIVEYLDRGKTVAETKAIYKKIKNKLNESADASKKLVGSSSKVTTPGSAQLNESAEPKTNDSISRWRQLAGIKNK